MHVLYALRRQGSCLVHWRDNFQYTSRRAFDLYFRSQHDWDIHYFCLVLAANTAIEDALQHPNYITANYVAPIQSPITSHGSIMFNLNTLVQKAQSLIDPNASPVAKSPDVHPSKAALFRLQFRLPNSESPLHEITAELSFAPASAAKAQAQGNDEKSKAHDRNPAYVGKLHLSENYLCFTTQPTSFRPSASLQASTAFNGQTHGAGPAGNGFTLPLVAIRRVERLQTQNSLFALSITTSNGFITPSGNSSGNPTQKLTVQLAGNRQACETFCDGLKQGLREATKDANNLKVIVNQCYSEYLLTEKVLKSVKEADTATKSPPDVGLGLLFRYPGDARKTRDKSKMRLWAEYLRGGSLPSLARVFMAV